jgi:protein-S-isoprenylcysteine O-methyltransferase Ste14
LGDEVLTFHKNTLRQIKLWAWAASVGPITVMASFGLAKIFGTETVTDIIIVSFGTMLFAVAVIWWWWVMYTIAKISQDTANTADNIGQVVTEVKSLRKELKE